MDQIWVQGDFMWLTKPENQEEIMFNKHNNLKMGQNPWFLLKQPYGICQ